MLSRLSRRETLAAVAGSAAAAVIHRVVPASADEKLTPEENPSPEQKSRPDKPLCIFAKPLQWLSFEEVADLLVKQRWDGIEATVRKGGQVDPGKVVQDLPRLVETLQTRGKAVTIMASGINTADDRLTEKVLETAAKLGIRRYRMAYYKYDLSKPILPQLDRFTAQLERLADLNHQLGLQALYQNHAGDRYFGAGMWDLYQAASELPTQEVAVAFDIRHATAEAALSWPVHWKLLRPLVGALYFKDFQWNKGRLENVPLGEGMVKQDFYDAIKQDPLPGTPLSIHVEYVDHRDPKKITQTVEAYARERVTVKRLLGR